MSGASASTATSTIDGVDHRGDRRARARADVGGGARDRAGRRDAAEERGDDVADAQREQLGVRIVPRARHAVGDHRREQRLDRAEHRDRERRGEQLAERRERSGRAGRRRAPAASRAASAAAAAAGCRRRRDRRRWRGSGSRSSRRAKPGTKVVERRAASAGQRERHQRRRHPLGEPAGRRTAAPASRAATRELAQRRRAAGVPHRAQTARRSARALRASCEPERSLSWSVAITVAMPAVKPGGDRVRDELDQLAEPDAAHRDQDAGRRSGPRAAARPGRTARRSAPGSRRTPRSAR